MFGTLEKYNFGGIFYHNMFSIHRKSRKFKITDLTISSNVINESVIGSITGNYQIKQENGH